MNDLNYANNYNIFLDSFLALIVISLHWDNNYIFIITIFLIKKRTFFCFGFNYISLLIGTRSYNCFQFYHLHWIIDTLYACLGSLNQVLLEEIGQFSNPFQPPLLLQSCQNPNNYGGKKKWIIRWKTAGNILGNTYFFWENLPQFYQCH